MKGKEQRLARQDYKVATLPTYYHVAAVLLRELQAKVVLLGEFQVLEGGVQ